MKEPTIPGGGWDAPGDGGILIRPGSGGSGV
jgi:hypothetical protein